MDVLVSTVADFDGIPLAAIDSGDVDATLARMIGHAENGVQTADFESSI